MLTRVLKLIWYVIEVVSYIVLAGMSILFALV